MSEGATAPQGEPLLLYLTKGEHCKEHVSLVLVCESRDQPRLKRA